MDMTGYYSQIQYIKKNIYGKAPIARGLSFYIVQFSLLWFKKMAQDKAILETDKK